MPYLQTCHRHPEAGRFMAECFGCKRELFDIEQRNRLEADARAAISAYGTDPRSARILRIERIGTALIVATEQPGAYHAYAVDTFRRPTEAETDPRKPTDWVLIDSAGSHGHERVGVMVAEATAYLAQIGTAA